MFLGKGSSGVVTLLSPEETAWLRTKSKILFRNAVKKTFHLPGSEAVAEYYFGRFLSQRFPTLFVQPLLLVHAWTPVPERFKPETYGSYILYMKEEQSALALDSLLHEEKHDDSKLLSAFEALVRALHECGIIHNDINLSNLFLEKTHLKLFDFGKASFDLLLDAPLGKELCSFYNAPELRENKIAFCDRDNASDLWSVGLCLFLLLYKEKLSPEMRNADAQTFAYFVCSLVDTKQEPQIHPFLRCWMQLDPLERLKWGSLGTTRAQVWKHLPWVNRHRSLSAGFRKVFSEELYRFLLLTFQRNKKLGRKDPVCVILGSFNLFLEFLLKKHKQDKKYQFSCSLVPYVDACRALVVHLLSPKERFSTHQMFPEIQYLLLQVLHYDILLQPLEIPKTQLTCNFVGNGNTDLFPLLSYIKLDKYPL